MRPVQTAVKALLTSLPRHFEFAHWRALHDEFEILNPCAAADDKLELVRSFGNHLESHVLQHGQQIGDRDRVLAAENFQKNLSLRRGSAR